MADVLQAGTEPVPGYRLLVPLGRGGFGQVWKACGPGGVMVALKFVSLADGGGKLEQRSLEVIKDIRHPHLISLFGAWRVSGFLVMAMELAERTLLDRFQESVGQGFAGIPAPEIHEYFWDAARGVDFLNEPRHSSGSERGTNGELLGIQHRDIKPQNILLVGGSVKVADFGLARVLEHAMTGHTGAMTPAYAAPEFFAGQTSSQSDQYSLAVTYCHLRGGQLPFSGAGPAIMAGHVYSAPDLSMLPEGERPAVARALAKKPQDRWPSCREFVDAVRSGLAGGKDDRVSTLGDPVDSLRSDRSSQAPQRQSDRAARRPTRALFPGAAATVLVVLAALAAFNWPRSPRNPAPEPPKKSSPTAGANPARGSAAPTPDPGSAASKGWALEFSRQGDRVRTSVTFDASYPILIEAVVRARSAEAGNIVGDINNVGSGGLALRINPSGHWSFVAMGQARSHGVASKRALIVGKRVHLAGIYDPKGGRQVLILDGLVQADAKRNVPNFVPSKTPLFVGSSNPGDGMLPIPSFLGQVEWVRIAQVPSPVPKRLVSATLECPPPAAQAKLLLDFTRGVSAAVPYPEGTELAIEGPRWSRVD